MKPMNSDPLTRPEDMALCRDWTSARFADPAKLPFSFIYDGEKISGIPASWHPVVASRRIDANLVETTYEGKDDDTGLSIRAEAIAYRDYPVIEWIVWLSNAGDQPTPILSDIRGLDGSFAGESPVIQHCNGDFYSETGYAPSETPLPEGAEFTLAPNGGRPCDGAFPYIRVQFEGCGVTLAVGWPGQWAATFAGEKDGVSAQIGQELTHLRLMPGERIRTPRMTALFWTGDSGRSINVWRRWYLAHILPRPDGQPMPPLMSCAGTDDGEEFTAATEENQLRYIEKFAQNGIDFDVWWIDAGWYPCKDSEGIRRWWGTGTWIPDPDRFPNGLKSVSDKAAEKGAKLLMWFEPERVTRGSGLFNEHPEWLLQREDSEYSLLLNLGDPAARRWLTDHICDLIRENGIGVYRQDFNFEPLEYWRKNDPEDRQGMNENLHVQGYLAFWDELLARNPGLWIDSCASGGRRNDLETMRRSVPLHYTDYGYGNHPVKMAFHHTLQSWIPYFKEVTLSWDLPVDDGRYDQGVDSFSYHCGYGAMLSLGIDIKRDGYDYDLIQKMIAIWREAGPILIFGDYYPLTPFSSAPDRWVAWRFDRPERGDGFVQGIRLAACPDETLVVSGEGFDADANYLFANRETGEERRLSGADLARDGFSLSLPPRNGAIWFYRKA